MSYACSCEVTTRLYYKNGPICQYSCTNYEHFELVSLANYLHISQEREREISNSVDAITLLVCLFAICTLVEVIWVEEGEKGHKERNWGGFSFRLFSVNTIPHGRLFFFF